MKYGIREICDVVLKAKATQKVGNKIFYPGEPVIYFDTLKTSSLEGASTTVYATGGRGNPNLVSWDGERTLTFTMEDALISPEGFMILSGAGLIDSTEKPIYQHVTETVDRSGVTVAADKISIKLSNCPYLPTDANGNYAYVMFMRNGEIISEPYIPVHGEVGEAITKGEDGSYTITVEKHDIYDAKTEAEIDEGVQDEDHKYTFDDSTAIVFDSVLVDYYIERRGNAVQLEITADKFGGNYYLEASTLFRDTNGVDMPAEFIIPNCRIQSNFTFSMASTGDPSTFTFTMDAFPDYTRFDHSKKVLAALQMISEAGSQDLHRHSTVHEAAHDLLF